MKNILIIILSFFLVSCAAPKIVYVPTEAETKIEYVDSLVYIRDTVLVEIPREKIVEVVPQLDTSRIETSIAISEAYLDTKEKKLRHTLKNKETALKAKLDTIVRVEYINKYIEKPIIKEVEVEVPYIPTFAWICIVFTFMVAAGIIVKIFLKFK